MFNSRNQRDEGRYAVMDSGRFDVLWGETAFQTREVYMLFGYSIMIFDD